MKLSVSKTGFTLKNISGEQLDVINYILMTAAKRCFADSDYDEDCCRYFDGGDFVASITKEERQELRDFVGDLKNEFQLLKQKIEKL